MLLSYPVVSELKSCDAGQSSILSSLRRLVSITLLALLGLPFALPLLALSARSEANLPACCRRNGKHHCMMSMAERARQASRVPHAGTPPEKCPCCPAAIVATASGAFTASTAQAIFAGVSSPSANITQTESKLRISLSRSRQKRGPPDSLFL